MMLLSGFIAHVLFLVLAYGLANEILGFPYTLSLICCITVGTFLLIEKRFHLSGLGIFIAPLGLFLMSLSSVLFHFGRDVQHVSAFGPLLGLHLTTVVLANVFFILGFSVSVALIVQETLIKKKRLSAVQRRLPSLATLDRVNAFLFTSGFVLMTFGVVSGIVYGLTTGAQTMRFDQRFFWSALTLLVYAMLLIARHFRGWRGRRAAWLAVAGFSTIVASFLGVNVIGGSFHVY